MGNMSNMYILATLFLSVSESLPTTAYIKMIEVWLIFTLMIPFLQVLILTFIHLKSTDSNPKQESMYTVRVQPHKDDEEHSSSVQKGRMLRLAIIIRDFGMPIFVLIFFIIYMTAGLMEANK